ncbi:MAG: aminotransferase class V-fold PLP-dependent enzyme [Syntrophomonadaceae bacterium]|nr:aminotransferase class V-fold PLP-dependent enzyme [Syntrophomonadaceae bacterium]
MGHIYLDNAATSFPKPEEVYDAVDDYNRYIGGNPGRGSNQQTIKAGAVLFEAREALAELFNIEDSRQIAFTLNVTDAINMGLQGLLKAGDHVITTSMEHNSVARPLYALEKRGIEWTRVATDNQGLLNVDDVKKAIKSNTRLICILHASNVIGTIMPIAEIGHLAREYDLVFMLDTAQTAGVLELDVIQQNIDILTFTGHKSLLGPQGTGGIYVSPQLSIKPYRQGGTGSLSEYLEHPAKMPDLLESGTPNTPGIAGLLAGVNYVLKKGINTIREYEQNLTALLISGLEEIKGVEVYGVKDVKHQTSAVAFNIKGVDCGQVSLLLDYKYNIISRSGLHCSPLAHQTIGTLELGALRFSPSFFNTTSDIEESIKAINAIVQELG